MSIDSLAHNSEYQEYQQLQMWFENNDADAELPEEFKRWLDIWKTAIRFVDRGISYGSIAKILIETFPEYDLKPKTAWKHVTNAVNWYYATNEIPKQAQRNMLVQKLSKVFDILYEALPSNPKLGKELREIVREQAEILGVKKDDDGPDINVYQQNNLIFSTDANEFDYEQYTDKELLDMLKEYQKTHDLSDEDVKIIYERDIKGKLPKEGLHK